MPWAGKNFAARHNHALTGKAATKAAEQATAMVRSGVPEGEAIATANKTGNRLQGSPKSRKEHIARLAKHADQKTVAKAVGVHPSTVSRSMRQGFNRLGDA